MSDRELEWTAGPWEYAMTDQWGQQFDIFESKTTRTMARTVLNLPIEEQEQNARLIAAAPEMAEALEELELRASLAGVPDDLEREKLGAALEQARAALAKARGKSK